MNAFKTSCKAWALILRGYRWRGKAFCLSLLFLSSTSFAQNADWFSIGPKLGYTFGAGGGFSYGVELTYFPTGSNGSWEGPLNGFTFDVTHVGKGRTTFHFGVEWMEGLGVDIGPTLLVDDRSGVSPGLGVTPFVTILLIPFYEFVWLPGQGSISTVGSYIKFPVGLNLKFN
jgi:hypothetical protein